MVSSHQLTFGRQLIVRATAGRPSADAEQALRLVVSWYSRTTASGQNDRQCMNITWYSDRQLIRRPLTASITTIKRWLSATIKTTVSWENDHYTTENDSQLIHRPLAVTHATTQSFSRSYSPFPGLEGPLSGPWKYPIRRERQRYASTASSGNEGYSTTEEATRI